MIHQNVTKYCRALSEDKVNVYEDTKSSKLQPVFALSDYHLFLYLKKQSAGQKFEKDDEMKVKVQMWL